LSHARGSERRFCTGVTAADYDYVKFCRKEHGMFQYCNKLPKRDYRVFYVECFDPNWKCLVSRETLLGIGTLVPAHIWEFRQFGASQPSQHASLYVFGTGKKPKNKGNHHA
jgi:hypothetical protein